jgi:FixJ family two-component response regulator
MIKEGRFKQKITSTPLVVIVDDDESIRESIQSLIRSVGFRAEVFPSAEELLDSDLLQDTDCLILDVRMDGMSGPQLQRRLNEMGSKIPIIFITAHSTEQLRIEALMAGAIKFLSKPFREEDLLDSIELALRRSKQRRYS